MYSILAIICNHYPVSCNHYFYYGTLLIIIESYNLFKFSIIPKFKVCTISTYLRLECTLNTAIVFTLIIICLF